MILYIINVLQSVVKWILVLNYTFLMCRKVLDLGASCHVSNVF